MSIKKNIRVRLLISMSIISFYGATTFVHADYKKLLAAHNTIVGLLGGSEGLSNRPATPIQANNLVYITINSALAIKETDHDALKQLLENNNVLIEDTTLSASEKTDRLNHYKNLTIIYLATKRMPSTEKNLFHIPQLIKQSLNELLIQSDLERLIHLKLKKNLTDVTEEEISEILTTYEFIYMYDLIKNKPPAALNGYSMVDYKRALSPETGNTRVPSPAPVAAHAIPNTPPAAVALDEETPTSAEVPEELKGLNNENIAKLKRMMLFIKSDSNEHRRAAKIAEFLSQQTNKENNSDTNNAGLGMALAQRSRALNAASIATHPKTISQVEFNQLATSKPIIIITIRNASGILDEDTLAIKIGKLESYITQKENAEGKKSDETKAAKFLSDELKKGQDKYLVSAKVKVESIKERGKERYKKLEKSIANIQKEIAELEEQKKPLVVELSKLKRENSETRKTAGISTEKKEANAIKINQITLNVQQLERLIKEKKKEEKKLADNIEGLRKEFEPKLSNVIANITGRPPAPVDDSNSDNEDDTF